MRTVDSVYTPPSAAVQSTTPPAASQDATEQAAYYIGVLAMLASSYSNATTQAQKDAILAQFQKILANFHVSGSTVTFTYTEADGETETVTINDPTICQVILGTATTPPNPMPTDITKFLAWAEQTSQPGSTQVNPIEQILYWNQVNNINFASITNPATRAVLVLFMTSLAFSPIGQMSGAAADFLAEGYENGAYIDNATVLAQLLSVSLTEDPSLDPTAIADCFATLPSSSPASVKRFAQIFLQNYQTWMANPPSTEAILQFIDSRFWPYSDPYTISPIPKAPKAPPMGRLTLNQMKDLGTYRKDGPQGPKIQK